MIGRGFPPTHALGAMALGQAFEALGVSASLWDGRDWFPIFMCPNVIVFEVEHAVEVRRSQYNEACRRRAWRDQKLVIGELGGLIDFFCPIVSRGRVLGLVVAGPCSRTRPTSSSILERWRWITQRQGYPADPEFSLFLSIMLRSLVLEGDKVDSFGSFLTVLCGLLAGDGDPSVLRRDALELRAKLETARSVEQSWEAAASLVDTRTSRTWLSPYRHLSSLGLGSLPNGVMVGLLASREAEPDPVLARVKRDAFQRQCVNVARSAGNAISGNVGENGVMFLTAGSGAKAQRRQRLVDLGDKSILLARQHGFRLHLGLSSLPAAASLPEHYQAASSAAESALTQGARLVESVSAAPEPTRLRELRRELATRTVRNPATLAVHFERYLQAVEPLAAHRLDTARKSLEAGFSRLTETLLDCRALDEASLDELAVELERSTHEAQSSSDLCAAFRRAVQDLAQAVQHRKVGQHDRSVRRAVTYMHQHFCEALSLPKVARVAGFAPDYFSLLFKKREGVTFERYVRQLRVERAKQLLASTDIDLEQVAHLSGFRERHHFSRVFKALVGATPGEHRRQAGPAPKARALEAKPSRRRATARSQR